MTLDIYIDNFSFDKKSIFIEQKISLENKNILGIIGENGIGKSTFVNLVVGNIESSLNLNYDGISLIPGYNNAVIFIPDDFIGLEYLTPFEATKYYLLLDKKDFDEDRFYKILEVVNIDKEMVFNEYIKNLSKGTKQKVTFILYMMINRDIIVFDEGLENIDEISLSNILNHLKIWIKEENKICLVATHSKKILDSVDGFIRLKKQEDITQGTIILKEKK